MSNYPNEIAGKKIAALRKRKDVSQNWLGKNIGVTQGAISKIERGDTELSKYTTAIAKLLGVTAESLLDPKISIEEILKMAENASNQRIKDVIGDYRLDDTINHAPDFHRKVPLISWVQAGDWCGIIDNFLPGDAEDWLPCIVKVSEHAFALRVRGASMEPEYQDGDIIFVDPDIAHNHKKCVIVRLENSKEATFKQLIIEGNQKYLRPLNPDWPEKIIPLRDDAMICGVVVGKWVQK